MSSTLRSGCDHEWELKSLNYSSLCLSYLLGSGTMIPLLNLSVVRQLMDGFVTHHHPPSFPHMQCSLMLGRTSQSASEFQHILVVVCLAKWCRPFSFLLFCLKIEWEDFQDSWSKRKNVQTEFYPIDCTTFSSAFSYFSSVSHWMFADTSYIEELRISTGDVFETKVRWVLPQVVCVWQGQMHLFTPTSGQHADHPDPSSGL